MTPMHHHEQSDALHVRPATPADREWIVALSPRLHEFGPPPWRPLDVMNHAVARSIEAGLDRPDAEATVYVCEDSADERLGFAHVHTARDFFTGEEHGHLSDLVVSPTAEGRGVGSALLGAVEDWSRERGHRVLTLNVFAENGRALSLYERRGYRPDTLKLLKEL